MSAANYKMILLPHGATAFFKDGEQVPEIQRNSWMILQFRELQRHGIDPRDVEITAQGIPFTPNARTVMSTRTLSEPASPRSHRKYPSRWSEVQP